jgi:hypothetical protein
VAVKIPLYFNAQRHYTVPMLKLILAAILLTSTPALADSIGIADCGNADGSISITVEKWDTGAKTAYIVEKLEKKNAADEDEAYSYYTITKKQGAENPTYAGKNFELEIFTKSKNPNEATTPAHLRALTETDKKLDLYVNCSVY